MSESPISIGTVDDAARITGLSKGALVHFRLYAPEHSPPFFRVGRRVLYPLTGPNSLQSWIADRVAACSKGA